MDWFDWIPITAMWLEREWDSARDGDALGAALVSSSAGAAVSHSRLRLITDLCFLTSGPCTICEGTETQLHTVTLSDPRESLNLLGTSTPANTSLWLYHGISQHKAGLENLCKIERDWRDDLLVKAPKCSQTF